MTVLGDALLQAEARHAEASRAYDAEVDAARLKLHEVAEEARRVRSRVRLRDLLLHMLADFKSPSEEGWQLYRLGEYALGVKDAPEGWPAVRKALHVLIADSPVLHWDGHEYIVRKVIRDGRRGRYEHFTAERAS